MQSNHTSPNYTWSSIYKIAIEHKKTLIYSNVIAILATIASVPVPLLMPLLVDEVLLNKPGFAISFINPLFPVEWHLPVLYISVILIASLILRIIASIFNIIQARYFSCIAKDIIFRIRKNMITLSLHQMEM